MGLEHGHAHQHGVVFIHPVRDAEIGVDAGGVGKNPLAQAPRATGILTLGRDADAAKEAPEVVAGLLLEVGSNFAKQPGGAGVANGQPGHGLVEAVQRATHSVRFDPDVR